jgi:hypothetical protein
MCDILVKNAYGIFSRSFLDTGQPEERGISHLLVPEIDKELPLINK